MSIVGRLLCRLYHVSPDELDKLAAARPRNEKWSAWAKRVSGR